MRYAVSKIFTSRFKQVKVVSRLVTFLWYSLCLTLGLQDVLTYWLSRDISNTHKELLKYLVLHTSCKIHNCLCHAIAINEWKHYSRGTGRLELLYVCNFFHEYPESICPWESWPDSSAVILMAPPWARYFYKSNPNGNDSLIDLNKSTWYIFKWWYLFPLEPSALPRSLITVPLTTPYHVSWDVATLHFCQVTGKKFLKWVTLAFLPAGSDQLLNPSIIFQ